METLPGEGVGAPYRKSLSHRHFRLVPGAWIEHLTWSGGIPEQMQVVEVTRCDTRGNGRQRKRIRLGWYFSLPVSPLPNGKNLLHFHFPHLPAHERALPGLRP